MLHLLKYFEKVKNLRAFFWFKTQNQKLNATKKQCKTTIKITESNITLNFIPTSSFCISIQTKTIYLKKMQFL